MLDTRGGSFFDENAVPVLAMINEFLNGALSETEIQALADQIRSKPRGEVLQYEFRDQETGAKYPARFHHEHAGGLVDVNVDVDDLELRSRLWALFFIAHRYTLT